MIALAVLWAPVRTLSRVAEERRVLLAFGVTALYAALSLVGAALAVYGGLLQAQLRPAGAPPLPPEFERFMAVGYVLGLILTVLSPFLFWLLVSGLMHLVTGFFGGTGPFSWTLVAVGVAQAPLVVSTAMGIPVTSLQVALAGPRARPTPRPSCRRPYWALWAAPSGSPPSSGSRRSTW